MHAERLAEAFYGGSAPNEIADTATHEAGHAVAAALMGHDVGHATMAPEGGLRAHVSVNMKADRVAKAIAEAGLCPVAGLSADGFGMALVGAVDALVTLAGPLASAMTFSAAVPLEGTDATAFKSSVAAVRRAMNCRLNDEAVAARIEDVARSLLASEGSLVRGVAAALAEVETIPGSVIHAVVAQHRKGRVNWVAKLALALGIAEPRPTRAASRPTAAGPVFPADFMARAKALAERMSRPIQRGRVAVTMGQHGGTNG